MGTREEIKNRLKNWMNEIVRSTHRKAVLSGQKCEAGDICFAFRSNLGIRMTEKFVEKALRKKEQSNE